MTSQKNFLPLLALSLLLILLVGWNIDASKKFSKTPPREPLALEVNSCQKDIDCVVVAKPNQDDPCCLSCDYEAVNKETEKERRRWSQANCSQVQCPVYDCYSEKSRIPKCVAGRCEISLVGRGSEEYCRWLESEVDFLLEEGGYCQQDSDCVVVVPPCPFGCSQAVHKELAEEIENKISFYNALSCSKAGCMYKIDCRGFPFPGDKLQCLEGKCVKKHLSDQEKEIIRDLVIKDITGFENTEGAKVSLGEIKQGGESVSVEVMLTWPKEPGLCVGYLYKLKRVSGRWEIEGRERTIVC